MLKLQPCWVMGILSLWMIGCGQKGPLYLPQESVINSVEDIKRAAAKKREELENQIQTQQEEQQEQE